MDGTASTRVSDGSAKDFVVKNLHFAITNQTCKESQQNTTGYACVSVNRRVWPSTQVMGILVIGASASMALKGIHISKMVAKVCPVHFHKHS